MATSFLKLDWLMPVIPECTVLRQGLCVSFSNMTRERKKCSQMIIASCQQSHNFLSKESREKSCCQARLAGCEAPELSFFWGPTHSLSSLSKASVGHLGKLPPEPDLEELPSWDSPLLTLTLHSPWPCGWGSSSRWRRCPDPSPRQDTHRQVSNPVTVQDECG